MNRALLAKELRALRPQAWSILGLWTFMTIVMIATELPDAQPFTPELWLDKSREGTFIVLFLFTLLVGAGLMVRESDEGTLRFLDALPLSRTRLFFAKAAAALMVLAWIPALGLAGDIGFGLLSRTSVDGPIPWRFGLVVAGLQMVAATYLLAVAMVVSFVRNWFALVTGLLFWTYLLLRQFGVSWLAYIDPYALLGPGLANGQVQVAWPQIGAHLGAAAGLMIVAWLGFRHLGDNAQRLADRMDRHLVLRIVAVAGVVLAIFIWIGALVFLIINSHSSDHDDDSVPVGEGSFTRRETKRYEFLLRSAQNADAQALFGEADKVHDQVTEFLGVPRTPSRVVVDLASPVMSHAAGLTNWTKIRMPLTPGQEFAEQRRILGHETTHVYIEQLGNGRLSDHFSSIRCLHEGLATYVEEALFAPSTAKASHRRAVAGAWSRGKIPFSLLVDDEALKKQRDQNLVYPLGAELARALIDTHGRDGPARFLRAIVRPNAPPRLKGVALWRDGLQAAGLSFERVAAAYETACAEIATAEKDFTDGLPKLAAEVAVEGGEIVFRPKYSGDAPGRVVCLVESDEPFGMGVQVLIRRKDGAFTLERSGYLKSSIRYLLGWQTPETEQPIFELWAEATL